MKKLKPKSIHWKIRIIAKNCAGNMKAMSEKTKIPYGTLIQIYQRDSDFSMKIIETILKHYPEVSAEWLLRDKGEMLLPL